MLHELVHTISRIVGRGDLAPLDDAELLRRFVVERDAAAFEVLVRRHGGMVLATCARVLGRRGDIDDAFQATFLTLVQQARSVRAGESLAGWLHRVARHVSIRAGRQRVRQARRECLTARPEAVRPDDAERADWWAHLDREVERLPARYRDAFVLCHLEGKAHTDAARELGCPLGTLQSRLARAKERLRSRLGPCSLVLPAAVVSTRQVNAVVSIAEGSVVASAAAVALSQGVWSPMTLIPTKFVVAAVLSAAVLGSGAVLLERPTATAKPTLQTREPTIDELKRENERLRREVAELKKRLEKFETTKRELTDPPTDAEILRAMPRKQKDGVPYVYEMFRDDITIVKKLLVDRLDPPRFYPLIGEAQLHHKHWECTVYYTETEMRQSREMLKPEEVKTKRVAVVYLDRDALMIRVRGKDGSTELSPISNFHSVSPKK